MVVRKATVDDVPAIHALVKEFARQEAMLPLSLSDVYEKLRDFFVADRDDTVVGCAALHVVWEDLAEVRSVAVRDDLQGQGVGRDLVLACVSEAPALGVTRVFTLTYVPQFFRRLGFADVEKDALPHKVWSDCVRCPHFPNCDEVALIAELEGEGIRSSKGG